jgi:hypothetical protein
MKRVHGLHRLQGAERGVRIDRVPADPGSVALRSGGKLLTQTSAGTCTSASRPTCCGVTFA